MPPRRRLALQIALLLALVFGGAGLVAWPVALAVLVALELVLAVVLVRPWAPLHGGPMARAVATLVVVAAVVLPALFGDAGRSAPTRRLGVGIAAGAHQDGDPPVAGGVVNVTSVTPGSAADGVLVTGDRIVALGEAPLDRADPAADLTRRTRSVELPEDTSVTVVRDASLRVLPVRIPRVRDGHARAFGEQLASLRDVVARRLVVATAVRGALLTALVFLLLRADGQGFSAIGLTYTGAKAELAAAGWMVPLTFAFQVAISIPIAALASLAGLADREGVARAETLGALARQGTFVELVLAIVVAAAFEEVVFRGFLTPRVRVLVGSWPLAIAMVSAVFGLGHVYEGKIAVLQTACLGAYFGALFLRRGRLLGPIVAHAAFNVAMLALARAIVESGVLSRLGPPP